MDRKPLDYILFRVEDQRGSFVHYALREYPRGEADIMKCAGEVFSPDFKTLAKTFMPRGEDRVIAFQGPTYSEQGEVICPVGRRDLLRFLAAVKATQG